MNMKGLPEDYKPSIKEVEWFLNNWQNLPNYSNQEKALDKLFMDLCKFNDNIEDILIKCSTLNDFYSTNIYDVYSVAQHLFKIDRIDERLKNGDPLLIKDIAKVKVGKAKTERTFYSFATKYCSFHQPTLFPIYDSYVEKVLWELKNRVEFSVFKLSELKDYPKFKKVVDDFRNHYGLTEFNYKELDQYLWQLGKKYFG